MTTLEQTIAAVAARCLRTDIPIQGDTPFARLGLDSLGTIELAAALETELGCELPADVLTGCCTARTLAARMAHEGLGRVGDPFDQMVRDSVLAADILPLQPVHRSTDLRTARNILVTGATGFLGAALVEALIAQTGANLVCLVRRGRQLSSDPRIRCIDGDLAEPQLGLSDTDWGTLAEGVDAVVHCGAAVNWVYSYGALRAANVAGTSELLRLASRAGAGFHFISSVSVCYAQDGIRGADEGFDGLPYLRQVHLGYAQTKIVAEALVRQAGDRGLPVRIYRPALISGHSQSGAYNRADLIATLVRGCVAMGTAPDLDWTLDAVPVDIVAKSILALSREDATTFHILHPRPRHWRECVLWMRMYGYDVRLLSYAAWLRQLQAETNARADHPLRGLRSFFLDRPAGAHGLTLPELFEDRRRTRAVAADTQARLASSGVVVPRLDAGLLDRYFAAFIQRGDLPPVGHVARRDDGGCGVVRPGTGLEILSTGSEHSIISELTSWRSQRPSGLFGGRMRTADGTQRDVIVKLKALDADVIAVGEAIADVVDPRVAAPYRRWSARLGFVGCHAREIAIYQQQDPRFRAHTPQVFATEADEAANRWLVIQERITDGRLLDSANDPSRWTAGDIDAAIDGLAVLQSIWFDRDAELRAKPWIGHVQTAAAMGEMSDLWIELAEHAAPLFSSWAGPDLPPLHRRLAATASEWWRAFENAPRTLIHGDFNPRNICLRGTPPRLCAYDWELATLGAPQRDLAEFLCFVLSPDTVTDAAHWIERHRVALSEHTQRDLDRSLWIPGFRAAMCDLLVNRLAIYAMVHRVKPQPFLPRVVATWQALARVTSCEAAL